MAGLETVDRAPGTTRSARRPEIEGLRGLAAVLVVVYHVWIGRVSGGVDVFFLLSGFFILGMTARSAIRGERVALATHLDPAVLAARPHRRAGPGRQHGGRGGAAAGLDVVAQPARAAGLGVLRRELAPGAGLGRLLRRQRRRERRPALLVAVDPGAVLPAGAAAGARRGAVGAVPWRRRARRAARGPRRGHARVLRPLGDRHVVRPGLRLLRRPHTRSGSSRSAVSSPS